MTLTKKTKTTQIIQIQIVMTTQNVIVSPRRSYAMTGTRVSSIQEACNVIPYIIESEPVARLSGKQIPGTQGLFRSDTGNCLGIHSPKYGFLQPCDSLQVLENAREMLGGEWGSVAVMKGGRQVMASILLDLKIVAPKRGDTVGVSLLYRDFWDGTGRAMLDLALDNLTCSNGMIARKSIVTFQEKHTGNLSARFSAMQQSLEANIALEFGETQRIVYSLDSRDMTGDEMAGFVEKLFPTSGEVSTRLENIRETVRVGFTRGTGNQGKTRWDAFNAVTEYLDWQSTFKETEFSREDNRMESLLNGNGARIRSRALELLMS